MTREHSPITIQNVQEKYLALKAEIQKVIIGQDAVIDQLLIGLLSRNHCLLVGVPGLAKTLLIRTTAEALQMDFGRVQFTPDLMPSDIVGTEILNKDKEFQFIKGPVFTQILLADEINRTPPKTQSALLEAMQERKVTAGGVRYDLDPSFFVLATQNPIEQEGTYPLPEAQLDRFLFQIDVDYPSKEEEIEMVLRTTSGKKPPIEPVLTGLEIAQIQDLVQSVPVPENVIRYAVEVVQRTRTGKHSNNAFSKEYIAWGAGPRASQSLITAAKCHALIHGKFSPDKEDILAIAAPTLKHRVSLNYKAIAAGIGFEETLREILG